MWIPIKDSFMFKASDPCENDGIIGTIGGVNKELEKINKIGWQADEKTIISWSDTEGPLRIANYKKTARLKI